MIGQLVIVLDAGTELQISLSFADKFVGARVHRKRGMMVSGLRVGQAAIFALGSGKRGIEKPGSSWKKVLTSLTTLDKSGKETLSRRMRKGFFASTLSFLSFSKRFDPTVERIAEDEVRVLEGPEQLLGFRAEGNPVKAARNDPRPRLLHLSKLVLRVGCRLRAFLSPPSASVPVACLVAFLY
jgi:hypothetical protein